MMNNLSLPSNNLHFTGERMIPQESHYATFWEHVYRYRFAAKYVKRMRVLDIACGEGYGTASLAKAGALSVIGMDISSEICEHARNKYGIDARVGDATRIPLNAGSIDLIISFETIEHLAEPEKFIMECARLLTSRGRLIISTPNKSVYTRNNYNNEFHLHEFTQDEFVLLLKKYFAKVTLYSQRPQSLAWTNGRSLTLSTSPWLRLRGIYRLRETLLRLTCPAFKHIEDYRDRATDLIQQNDHFLSFLVNPYLVVRCAKNEEPIYLVAVAEL